MAFAAFAKNIYALCTGIDYAVVGYPAVDKTEYLYFFEVSILSRPISYSFHRFKFAGRDAGGSNFHARDMQFFNQKAEDTEFFGACKTHSGCLLAIAEGCVHYFYKVVPHIRNYLF